MECKNCGSTNLFTEEKGTQVGIYCADCGKWIKWGTKEEVRVINHKKSDAPTVPAIPIDRIKQLREEINSDSAPDACNDYHRCNGYYDGDDISQEWVVALIDNMIREYEG